MSVRQLEDGSWERPVSFVPDQDWNLPQMLVRRQAAHPGQIAVERRTGVGSWRSITIDEVVRQVQETARGLVGLGLQAGERLAILAPTSYEWAVLDAATLSCGGVTVPIYETDSASQIHHILAEAEVVLVLTATSQQAELVESVRTPSVRRILALDRGAEREIAKAGSGFSKQVFSWAVKQARDMSAATAYVGDGVHPELTDETSSVPDTTSEASPGPGFGLRVRHRIADALALSKVRSVLGPNLQTVICGGAPLALDLANFYRGLGITLLQGYGLSETTGPIAVEVPDDFPPDSVGFPWPGNAMKIAEDGELLLRGVSVTKGYLNLPEQTAASFHDGWFLTGDLASIDDTGHLRITGRKKELIVTAGGKNVSPEVLEDALQSHPLISTVIVVGDGRPYIGALISLDPEMLPVWLANKGLPPTDPADAADLPAVRESLDRAIARANRQVSRAESIRRYRIVNASFSVENGYMTPSLKLKRRAVLRDFASEVDALYAAGEAEKAARTTPGTEEPGRGADTAGDAR